MTVKTGCMFTQSDLWLRWPELLREEPRGALEEIRMACAQCESLAVVHRDYARPYDGLLSFWVNSQRVLDAALADVFAVSPQEAECRPLAEREFLEHLVACLSSDFFVAQLGALGTYQGGLWMAGATFERQIAVAAVGDRYFAAYWHTWA